jgi:hypothetical protein
MRFSRRTFVTASAMALVAAAGADGSRKRISRYRTIPQEFCGLPDRDYIHGGPSQPALAISKRAALVLVPGAVPADTLPNGRQIKFYQLKTNELRVEHCSISRISLAIQDDGYWTLSLRADQNPQTATNTPLVAAGTPKSVAKTTVPQPKPLIRGASPTTKFTDHIKRNLFTVSIRGYTGYLTEGPADAAPGRPVLFQLLPDPFWVQRAVPLFPKFEGMKAEIKDFYKTIDRIEVELSYR